MRYGMTNGETYEITNKDEIPIGAAVFIYDPNNSKATERNEGWIHIGIYIGKTKEYEYAVAEAVDESTGVGIFPLSDSFTRWGYFKGVKY